MVALGTSRWQQPPGNAPGLFPIGPHGPAEGGQGLSNPWALLGTASPVSLPCPTLSPRVPAMPPFPHRVPSLSPCVPSMSPLSPL